MRFIFKAKTQKGVVKQGVIEALDRPMAVQLLQKNDLVPINVQEERKRSQLMSDLQRIASGADEKDLLAFFRELSTLVSAKVPIVPSLKTIHEQTTNDFMRSIIKDISDDVEDGMAISEALEKHPTVFTPLTVSMVRSGEVSGNLQGSIEYVTQNIEQTYQLNAKVRGALIYPAFVVSVAAVIGFLTITFILPKLTGVIKDLNVVVPWYTKAMIWLGDFMQVYWWAVLLIIFAGIVSIVYYLKTEEGSREWDRVKIRMPVLGPLFQYIYLTRFCENLSVLLSGGIPIVRALIVVSDVVDNSVYKKVILKAAQEVKSGGEINTVFFQYTDQIPPIVARMIKIGEETGRLSEILEKLAGFYRQEIDQITRNLSSIIEPVLIVFLGVGVGVLVFSVLLPIYNIAGQL